MFYLFKFLFILFRQFVNWNFRFVQMPFVFFFYLYAVSYGYFLSEDFLYFFPALKFAYYMPYAA